jgi:hypothetical protein
MAIKYLPRYGAPTVGSKRGFAANREGRVIIAVRERRHKQPRECLVNRVVPGFVLDHSPSLA